MLQEKVQKGLDGVERIGQKHIKGPWIGSQHALEQAQGGRHLAFPYPLGFEIHKQADRRTAWRRSTQQHQRHVAMVKLGLSVGHAALQTSVTTATIAGAGLMAIEHRYRQSVKIR